MTTLFGGAKVLNVSASGSLIPETFVPAVGQTVFTITKFTYTKNTNSLLVFLNGVKQLSGVDFVELSNTTFALTSPTVATDVVEVIGFPTATITQNVASYYQNTGYKNLLFNGCMRINERADSNNKLISNNISDVGYHLDRWYHRPFAGLATVARYEKSAQVYRMRFQALTESTQVNVMQRVESINAATLAGKPITVSFKASNPNQIPVNVTLSVPPSRDFYESGAAFYTYVTPIINSSEATYYFTCTCPQEIERGFQIRFDATVGVSGNGFTLGEVQIEPGPVFTSFELRPLGLERMLCSRYYERLLGVVSGGVNLTTYRSDVTQISWKATKRTSPTITLTPDSSGLTAGTNLAIVATSGVDSFYLRGAGIFSGRIDGDSEIY